MMINLKISKYGNTGWDGNSSIFHLAGNGNREAMAHLEMQGQMIQVGQRVFNSQFLIK